MEEFKDIPGYEGKYQVSEYGKIKSLPRRVFRPNGSYLIKGRVLSVNKNKGGYLQCSLWKNGSMYCFAIHQLVAMAFLGYVLNGRNKVVDHIDANKINNHYANLQITTFRDNLSKDRTGTSMHTGVFGPTNSNKWIAQISINNKSTYLGAFSTEIEAHEAYQNKLKTL